MNANGGIETMNEMTKTIIIVIIIVYSPQMGFMECYRSAFIPEGLEVRCRTLELLGEFEGDLFES